MIFKRNGLTVLFSILTITSCGGGSSSSDKKIEELNNIDNPVEEVLQKDNAIDESNAIELFRKHLGAVINNPLPIFDVAQIVINGDFSNEQNIPCNVSGVLTKEIIFQRQPHNSF